MSTQDDPLATPAKKLVNPVPKVLQLNPNALSIAENAFTSYSVGLPTGTAVADLERHDFWAHVAARLRPFDRIYAYSEDGTFIADLVVRSQSLNSAVVAVVAYKEFTQHVDVDAALLAGYDINYVPTSKWRVVRRSDNRPVQENLPSRTAAMKWLAESNLRAA